MIDWAEARIGDPAYDLAIVTRGRRRPLQVRDGLERLLDAYDRVAPEALTRTDVGIYELLLQVGIAMERERRSDSVPHVEQGWREVAGLLDRLR